MLRAQQELDRLPPGEFPLCRELLQKEIDRMQDVESLHVSTLRIDVPTDKYPNYNFIGRLIGPRGANVQRMEGACNCKIMVKVDPVHVVIRHLGPLSEREECLARAEKMVMDLLKVGDGDVYVDDLMKEQLKELAIINGTYLEHYVFYPKKRERKFKIPA